MPLTYSYFVKTTTIVSAPSDANDGQDPLGCNLSNATYDHTGGASGERQLTAGAGSPFSNVQAGDYIYLKNALGGVADGLYKIQSVPSATVILLHEDSGLTGDSLGDVDSSNGPWLTIQHGVDTMTGARANLVICADGGGTDGNWELTGNEIDFDTNPGGSSGGLHYRGGNARGVVDGTKAVIDGTSMTAGQSIFRGGGSNDRLFFWDLRLTASRYAGVHNSTASENDWAFYRCRFDNCLNAGVRSNGSDWAYFDCEFDNNAAGGVIVHSGSNGTGGGKYHRCRIHDNTGPGVESWNGISMDSCLVYDNTTEGVTLTNGWTSASGVNTAVTASVFYNNGSHGVDMDDGAFNPREVINCVFANNGAYGLRSHASSGINQIRGCVFHSNTSGTVANVSHDGVLGVPGADDNLWIEFTGGSYDNVGHADGDYRLEATGAFANLPYGYTGLVQLTDSGNITAGLYTIASKISDDAVLLAKSAGSDSTGNVTADNDPGFTSETDGSEDFTPTSTSILINLGLQVESR